MYEPGEVILKEESLGKSAFIIKEGQVEVFKTIESKVVALAKLAVGEIFGEMSLIDDRPRYASIRAVTKTILQEITRKDFNHFLTDDPDQIIPIIKMLFERLRNMNERYLFLEQYGKKIDESPKIEAATEKIVTLKAVSKKAEKALGRREIGIEKFPLLVGRKTKHHQKDALLKNDLRLVDGKPFFISRNHFAFLKSDENYYIRDRGSSLGTFLNDVLLGGGAMENRGQLQPGVNQLHLGGKNSGYHFQVVVE